MEEVNYTLLQVELIELSMPRPNFVADIEAVLWHYALFTNYSLVSADKICLRVTLSFSLYAKDDPEKKSICELKTRSSFKTDRLISSTAKLLMLYRFLNITLWNLQGVYAAKTQNIALGQILPSGINFRTEEELFKAEIDGNWR